MNSNKKIENSFSSRFDTSNIKDEGWNDPNEKVWEKIEKDLFPEKKKRFGFLPFILTGLLLMSFLFIGYLYTQNLELKTDIKETSNQISSNWGISNQENVKEIVSNEEAFSEVGTNEIKEINILATNESTITNNKSTIDIVKKEVVPNLKSSKEKDQIIVRKRNIEKTIWTSSSANVRASEVELFSPEIRSINNSQSVSQLNIKSSNEEKEKIFIQKVETKSYFLEIADKRIFTKPIKVEVQKENEISKSFISFLPNLGGSILKTIGDQETALTELIDKEYGDSGLGFDMTYTTPLSNAINFSIGIGVEANNFSTEYDITLPYLTEDETIVGESGYIDFEHSLPTAFGNTETALRLNRTRASDVLNESNVVLDFNTNHKFVALSLPVGLTYNLGGQNSFFNFGVNLRPLYLVHAASSIKSVVSHHSGIDAINNESVSTYNDIQNFNLSVGFEIGYQYALSSKGGIQMKLRAEDYLFDFYQVEEFSSSIKKVGLSIGYFYSL